ERYVFAYTRLVYPNTSVGLEGREPVGAAGGSTHVETVGSDVTPRRTVAAAGDSTHVETVGSDVTPQFVIFPERMNTDGILYCCMISDIARSSRGSW
ncbi:hypothetical protein J6590_098297, partial [Homalodisca vitripennis]